MKTFTFTVIDNESESMLNAVVIEVEAEKWCNLYIDDHYTDKEKDEWWGQVIHEKFIGLSINVMLLKDYLNDANIMYGQEFDPERHSPRELYEALLGTEYKILKIEGHNPDDDPPEKPLPPGAVY